MLEWQAGAVYIMPPTRFGSLPDGTAATPGHGDRMQIMKVDEVLVHEGLRAPELNALVPDESNYRVLLMQPHG